MPLNLNLTFTDTLDDFQFHHHDTGLEDEVSSADPLWIYLLEILYAVIFLVGLVGNCLVIYVIARFRIMQTITHLYIFNLAIADVWFLLGMPFTISYRILGYWPFGNFLCKMHYTTINMNYIASSFFLLIIAGDRYLLICHPLLASTWRTLKIAKCTVLVTWAVAVIPLIPVFNYSEIISNDMFGEELFHTNMSHCVISWPRLTDGKELGNMFSVYLVSIGFIIPLIFILLFYTLVICRLRVIHYSIAYGENSSDRDGRKAGGEQPFSLKRRMSRSSTKELEKSHKKVTRLVLIVIAVYFTCWAPYWAFEMADIFSAIDYNVWWTLAFDSITRCLAFANSAVNPFLYAFLSENFQISFKKACKCTKEKGRRSNPGIYSDNDFISMDAEHHSMIMMSTV